MRLRFPAMICLIVLGCVNAFAQDSWLDRPMKNWNRAAATLPSAPRAAREPQCVRTTRPAIGVVDNAMKRAGWYLFGAAQSYGTVTVVAGNAGFDGMCRPNLYNYFVFVNNRFAGTLSPTNMMARSDGSVRAVYLYSATEFSAEFNRYKDEDALCCPSRQSSVSYSIGPGLRGVVKPTDVNTEAPCAQ